MVTQLGSRIETQLSQAEQRLASLPRGADAGGSRTTHVKLSRDYRMVEERLKSVQLEVRRKKNLEEQRVREQQREEERRMLERGAGGGGGGVDLTGGGGVGGGDLTEEGRRWQMQIQEDVSGSLFVI